MTSTKKYRRLITGLLLAGGLVGLLWFGGHAFSRRQVVAASLPPRPALAAWPAELTDRIAEEEARARTYLRPTAGLAGLGRLYLANGFYNEALQCLDGLQRLEPGVGRWSHLQAGILAEFGRLEETLPVQERAVALAPDYIPARLRLGDVRLKANQTAAAAQAYTEVLAREADNPYARLGLAKCALVASDWVKAREQLEKATQAHPDFIGGLSLLVTVREHDGDAAGAEQLRATIGKREFTDFSDPWRDELFDDCYEPYLLSVAASKANFAGDRAAAHRWLARAIRFAPHPGTYHRQLGKMLLETNDSATAWSHLEKAVALEPTDSEAWSILVFSSTALGDMERADKALAAGLAACPQSAALHHASGQRLASLGRNQEAIREFALAKKLRPNEANAYISLALMYFRSGQVEPAVAELKAALTVQPGHPLALSTLARYSTDTGDEAAARHWIRQLRLQPRVPAADLNTVIAAYQQKFGRAPW